MIELNMSQVAALFSLAARFPADSAFQPLEQDTYGAVHIRVTWGSKTGVWKLVKSGGTVFVSGDAA